MLTFYQQVTRRLLADASFARFNDFDLRDWINISRNQVAGEGEAIRALGTLATVSNQRSYSFTSITIADPGVAQATAIRMIAFGGALLTPRQWEWMFEYYVAPDAASGVPLDWSQLGQGANGTFYLGPPPASVGTMSLDVVAIPAPLLLDSNPEALPWPFSDAVPYYAAYMALLSIKEFDGAERYYQLYERFVARARAIGTPSVLPQQYPGGRGARLAGQAAPITPQSSLAGAPAASPARGE